LLRSTSASAPGATSIRAAAAVLATGLLLAACSADAVTPTVNDDQLGATAEPVEVDDPSPTPTSEASLTSSEEASPTPDEASPAPTFEDVCAGREDEAFIEVLTPAPATEVAQTFTVTGCGNTFEATYLYRVVLDDGTVAAEGFGTMSCGTGCVGEFEQEISIEATGEVTLVLFESSAEDGSEVNVVETTLTVV